MLMGLPSHARACHWHATTSRQVTSPQAPAKNKRDVVAPPRTISVDPHITKRDEEVPITEPDHFFSSFTGRVEHLLPRMGGVSEMTMIHVNMSASESALDYLSFSHRIEGRPIRSAGGTGG
jgi:hypothetical protein